MTKKQTLCSAGCGHLQQRHESGRCSARYTTPDGSVYHCRCDGRQADAHPRVLIAANTLRGSAARAAARRALTNGTPRS